MNTVTFKALKRQEFMRKGEIFTFENQSLDDKWVVSLMRNRPEDFMEIEDYSINKQSKEIT